MTLQYYSEATGAPFKQTPFVRQVMQFLTETFRDVPAVLSDKAGTHLKCSDS